MTAREAMTAAANRLFTVTRAGTPVCLVLAADGGHAVRIAATMEEMEAIDRRTRAGGPPGRPPQPGPGTVAARAAGLRARSPTAQEQDQFARRSAPFGPGGELRLAAVPLAGTP